MSDSQHALTLTYSLDHDPKLPFSYTPPACLSTL